MLKENNLCGKKSWLGYVAFWAMGCAAWGSFASISAHAGRSPNGVLASTCKVARMGLELDEIQKRSEIAGEMRPLVIDQVRALKKLWHKVSGSDYQDLAERLVLGLEEAAKIKDPTERSTARRILLEQYDRRLKKVVKEAREDFADMNCGGFYPFGVSHHWELGEKTNRWWTVADEKDVARLWTSSREGMLSAACHSSRKRDWSLFRPESATWMIEDYSGHYSQDRHPHIYACSYRDLKLEGVRACSDLDLWAGTIDGVRYANETDTVVLDVSGALQHPVANTVALNREFTPLQEYVKRELERRYPGCTQALEGPDRQGAVQSFLESRFPALFQAVKSKSVVSGDGMEFHKTASPEKGSLSGKAAQ